MKLVRTTIVIPVTAVLLTMLLQAAAVQEQGGVQCSRYTHKQAMISATKS